MMQTTKPKMPCSTAQASSGRIGNIALNARAEAEIAAPPKTKVRIRACANRSWSARRSSLPTVAAPCFPDQPPDDDDHLREGHPEIYPPSPPALYTTPVSCGRCAKNSSSPQPTDR